MFLDKILASRKIQVEALKDSHKASDYMKQIEQIPYKSFSFKEAVASRMRPINIIAEIKKASPSKGTICEQFDYLSIAKAYEAGGAIAISVLTEPSFFKGDNRYLSEIKREVSLPLLRKDFIVDELQIYEAKAIGADAILLIVAALNDGQLKKYLTVAEELGLDVLVETHCEEEVKRALEAGASIIGVNNRDLGSFEVRLEISEKLSECIPKDKLFVSESGVHTKADVLRLKKVGAHALLIGESMMKATDPKVKLRHLMED